MEHSLLGGMNPFQGGWILFRGVPSLALPSLGLSPPAGLVIPAGQRGGPFLIHRPIPGPTTLVSQWAAARLSAIQSAYS